MGLFGYLGVLLIGVIIGLVISNSNVIGQLQNSEVNSGLNSGLQHIQQSNTNNTPSAPSGQSILDSCLSQVNSALQIAEAKLPSGTSVNIVNSTIFYYNSSVKNTISNINGWIIVWNSGYSFGSVGESCNSYYPDLFTCDDLSSLSGELNASANTLSYRAVVGAGVAIKFQFPPEAQSNGFTEVSPVLCNPTGLLSASHNYLVNKNAYS
jgi:hypothetical protein